MLTLMLLRHAKAEGHGRGDDFSRALTGGGEADAGRLGAFLADRGMVPSLALVSSAARTSRTFELVGGSFVRPPEAIAERALYNAEAGEIGARLRRVAPETASVMIVGHNPGIMDAAASLAADGDHLDLLRLRGRYPPCGLAVLTFDAEDWSDACDRGGRLDALVYPEDLAPDA